MATSTSKPNNLGFLCFCAFLLWAGYHWGQQSLSGKVDRFIATNCAVGVVSHLTDDDQ